MKAFIFNHVIQSMASAHIRHKWSPSRLVYPRITQSSCLSHPPMPPPTCNADTTLPRPGSEPGAAPQSRSNCYTGLSRHGPAGCLCHDANDVNGKRASVSGVKEQTRISSSLTLRAGDWCWFQSRMTRRACVRLSVVQGICCLSGVL